VIEPEYASDDYLLQKWMKLLPSSYNDTDRLIVAKMLETQDAYYKSPLQILAEESTRDVGPEQS